VIRGRYDMCTDAVAATLMSSLRHARDVVLEHSSHTPVLEETESYLAVVREFLRDAD
jgi:pimeloyl-ACP methyl ester carboxylesterase